MKPAPLLFTFVFVCLIGGCSDGGGGGDDCLDRDGDGYGAGTDCLGADCNDEDPQVSPGAGEVPYDGVDNDCDPATLDDDLDQDGFTAESDCDDENPEINPAAEESCLDNLDNDCDGDTDGADDACRSCAQASECDDENFCTDDSCPDGHCVNSAVADGLVCDDGLACTENDACSQGACSGVAVDCGVLVDSCNTADCDEAQGGCVALPLADGTACDDGLACTGSDTCSAGECSSAGLDCSDLSDACNAGVCDEEHGGCWAEPAADGTECDDGLFCTEADGCLAGDCLGVARDCSDFADDCKQGVCDESLGECVGLPVNEGLDCDDGDLCTLDEVCLDGSCTGSPVSCDQGEVCVDGECSCGGSGPDCSVGETCCDTVCLDTNTDPENCGGCGIDCLSYEYCETGLCTPICGIGETVAECWECKFDPEAPGPDYEQFDYILGSHCLGTNHQEIDGIERVVFLGDSITTGTPPNTFDSYRFVLSAMLKDQFGLTNSDIDDCSDWGARNDDLLLPPHQQILTCFPSTPDPRRTLVIMTVGSNDLFAMAKASDEGQTPEYIMQMAVDAMLKFDDAIRWFTDDPSKFPNGVFVIFANIYEYTDGTGDMSSCPSCALVGLCADWPEGRPPAVHMGEQYMNTAVNTGTDMIFLLENFCGHGWFFDNPESQCFLGEDSERWIDITCLHPEPVGHQQIADMFMAVINE